MRAHLYKTIADIHGDVSATASIALYQPGTTTAISASIYSSSSGNSTRTNPFTISNGTIDFYLDLPQRVRIGITLPSQSEQYLEDVDVLTSDYTYSAQIGVANGIAALDSNTKVPLAELPTGANGLATLDNNGRLLTSALPTNLGITTIPSRVTVRKTSTSSYSAYDAQGATLASGAPHTVINSAIDSIWNTGNGGGDVLLLAPRTKVNDAYELTGQINARRNVRLLGEWSGWGPTHANPTGGTVLRAVTGGVTWSSVPMITCVSSSVEDKSDFSAETITFDGAGIAQGAVLIASHGATLEHPRIYNFLEYGVKFTSSDLPNAAYENMRLLFAEIDMANNPGTQAIIVTNGSGGGLPAHGEIISPRIFQVKSGAIDTTGGPSWVIDGAKIYNSTFDGSASVINLGDYGSFMDSYLNVSSPSPWVSAHSSQFIITSNQFLNASATAGDHYIEVGPNGGVISANISSSQGAGMKYYVYSPQDLLAPAGMVISGNVATDCTYISSHGSLSRTSLVIGENFPALFETE